MSEKNNAGYIALWRAVLLRAIEDWRAWAEKGYPNAPTSGEARDKTITPSLCSDGDSARRWLFVSKDRGVGSFSFVCEVLDLSVDRVREQLRCRVVEWVAEKAEKEAEKAEKETEKKQGSRKRKASRSSQ